MKGKITHLGFIEKMNIVANHLEKMPSGNISEMSPKSVEMFHTADDLVRKQGVSPFNVFWIYHSPCLILLPHNSPYGDGFMKPLGYLNGFLDDKMLGISYTFGSPNLKITLEDPEIFYEYPWIVADDEWIDDAIRTTSNANEACWCLVAYSPGNYGPRYYTGYYDDQGSPKVTTIFDRALRMARKEDAEDLKKHLPKPFLDATPWKVEDHMYMID